MYVVVRGYSGHGASDLFDLLEQREEDVKSLISGVPGFVSYAAFRSGDGGRTWSDLTGAMTTTWVASLSLEPSGGRLYVGTTAYGLESGGGVFAAQVR